MPGAAESNPQMMLSRRSIQNTAFGIGAFVLSGALLRVFSSGESDLVTSGDPRFDLILAALYSIILVIALTHVRQAFRAAAYTPTVVSLLLLACLSALWAELPGLVLRRTVGLAGATLFGLVLASCLEFAKQRELLRSVFRIIAGLSVAAQVLGFDLIVGRSSAVANAADADGGAWRGIFNHKNGLGAIMALAILVEWHIPAHTVRSRTSKVLWLCAYAALLSLSNSVTSVVSVLLTILLMCTVKAFRCQYRLLMPTLFLVALFSSAFFTLNAGAVTAALGRSSDLTGRIDLWHWVGIMIRKRPLIGYGFSGFWRGASDQSTVVGSHIGWSPVYSHNGYLEILLSLGLSGLLLFLWFAVTGMRRALIRAQVGRSVQDVWPLAFLTFFLIHNLGECTILWQNSLEWAIAVATVVGSDPRVQANLEADVDSSKDAALLDVQPECP
jgi:exopolysaccharide production protein ExoQ